jgi:hypothetical protein
MALEDPKQAQALLCLPFLPAAKPTQTALQQQAANPKREALQSQ